MKNILFFIFGVLLALSVPVFAQIVRISDDSIDKRFATTTFESLLHESTVKEEYRNSLMVVDKLDELNKTLIRIEWQLKKR